MKFIQIVRFLILTFIFVSFISCSSSEKKVVITFEPANYDYSNVTYLTTADNDFTFTNNFNVIISIQNVTITGADAAQFSVIAGGGYTDVPAKGLHIITVQFSPTGGAVSAVINVEYLDSKGRLQTLTANITGFGVPIPLFTINSVGTPPAHDFGQVAVGQTADKTYTITNTGIADLTISNIQIAGTDYSISTGWAGTPVVVAPNNGTHDFTIEFAPTASGISNGSVSISHDATNDVSPYDISLEGEGLSRLFDINATGNPPAHDFGTLWTSKHLDKTFTVTNAGTDTLTLSNISVSGAGFSIQSGWSGNPISVNANNGTHDIVVRFEPTTGTAYNGTLSITHNGANALSPFVVTLDGQGKDNYSGSTFTKGMTPLTAPTTVTLSDDDYVQIPIGFTFNFYGNDYTQAYICSNGNVGFGTPTNFDWWEEYNLPHYGSWEPDNCIYPHSLDLDPTIAGQCGYKLEGSAPNRILTVEFLNLQEYGGGGNFISQVKLFETSNKIEIHYPTSGINWSYDAVVGIENSNGTKGVNLGGSGSNPIYMEPTTNFRYE